MLNPCGEAILRDTGGLCNLTEVIIRPGDTLADLKTKVKQATIIGTLQSTLSNFRYLRRVWSQNQKEERLLGVSLTGIMDHPVMSGREVAYWEEGRACGEHGLVEWLQELKEVARETNRQWSEYLGIPGSKQLTLVKPSGTVSQLCSTSSGIHPRYADRYLRRVTQDNKDPLTQLMVDQGVPHVVKGEKTVFTFPIEPPEFSVSRDSMEPLEQLELWLTYRDHWCEGNPSQTIYYTDETFLAIQEWVYSHWDKIGGLSFFPASDAMYDKDIVPYLAVNQEQYEKAVEEFPSRINWDELSDYETEDTRGTTHEYACSGPSCEL